MLTLLVFIITYLLGFVLFKRITAALLFSFTFLLPMRSILPQEQYIFYVISPDNIPILLLSFIFLFRFMQKGQIYLKINDIGLLSVFYILAFFILFNYYVPIKAFLFYSSNLDIKTINIIRDLIYFGGFYYFLSLLRFKQCQKYFEAGFVWGLAVTGLSIVFDDFFVSLGFIEQFDVHGRGAGFIGANPNTVGAVLALSILYLFTKVDHKNRRISIISYSMAGILMFIGVLGTGSRQAILIIVLGGIYFIYKFRKLVTIKQYFSFIVVFSLGFYWFITSDAMVLIRFQEGIETGAPLASRPDHYVRYTLELLNNPHYLFIGNFKRIDYTYGPHNYYLLLLFYSGLLGFLLFFNIIFKYLRAAQTYGFIDPIRYILIVPMLFSLFFNANLLTYNIFLLLAMYHGIWLYNNVLVDYNLNGTK